MNGFIQIITEVPWWAWVLLIVLGKMGLRASKPRTMSIQRILLVPAIFLSWSVYDLYQNVMQESASLILWWAISVAIGAYLGFKGVQSWRFQVDRRKKSITIPGNWSTLTLILLSFGLKFFWGFYYATLEKIPYSVYLADTCSLAILTGFFLGRATLFYGRYQKG